MRVVITGASRGIGRATAQKLAADGARALTLCDVAYLDELEALAGELRGSGCKVKTLRADMAKPREPAKVIDTAAKAMGGIDAIVGNAGIASPAKLVDLEGRGLGPPVQHQPARQLAAGQGRPSASAQVERRHRHGVVDVRRHAAASDRRLQPGQGGADHADRDDGHGMGARRHPRQRRLSGLRAYLDDRGDLQPAQARESARRDRAARQDRHAK